MKPPANTLNPSPDDDALDEELRDLEAIPESWLAVGEGRVRAEDAFPGDPALQAELAPLDPAARTRMVAHAMETLTRPPEAPRLAPVVPLAPRRNRWLRWTAPLAAAAAVLLVVFWPSGPGGDGLGDGEVRVFPALRGDAAGGAELRVAGGEHFYLRCRSATADALEIVAVRATKVGEPTDQRMLGGKPAPQDPRGDVLHVLADLGSGAWDVTCGARQTESGQFVWIGPPARVVIE
ncbi:hypothetical protein [Nannocystis sp. SCPEA4]|uniref:hypothetical protein n=1 Tax=Nannocystis sp. SCPEA4 TaxID=2996787 RepID=UPI00226DA27E|nr:hypothetical protein [Nannocystis sp. SCPEA4]MCY1061958.1 hypothetical protein [Nannocystis sp. SCPEA4]